jgi:aspartate 1-decarboxylase
MGRKRAPAPAGASADHPPPHQSTAGLVQIVRGKLHGLRVTGAALDYHGSITLDPEHCEAVGIQPMEFVDIWNKHSGARLSTYVILGQRGSRCCVLNGAAARTCQVGDAVIICASMLVPLAEAHLPRPRIAVFDADNRISELMEYRTGHAADGKMTFATVSLGRTTPRRSKT